MTTSDTPTPDPTILTMELVLREVSNSVALVRAEIAGLEGRLDEKFTSIATELALIERQRVEQKTDTATAVQAALSAAKEAVREQTAASEKSITKSETATAEQIKQLATTGSVADTALSNALADIKTRVERIESIRAGVAESRPAADQQMADLRRTVADLSERVSKIA